MSDKIQNPYLNEPNYHCFGCSPNNPIGLHLEFWEEGDTIRSEWQPTADYQGYINYLHGGIAGTLLDEIASWVIFTKLKTGGFTSNINLRYRHPVHTNEGAVQLTAKILQQRRNIVDIAVKLHDCHGNLCVEGTITYFTYSPEKSHYLHLISTPKTAPNATKNGVETKTIPRETRSKI